MNITPEPDQNFRIVKVQLESGAWLNMPQTYKSESSLNQALQGLGTIKGVYSGVSKWRNALDLAFSFKPKPAFLNSDLVIDLDDEDSPDSHAEIWAIKEQLDKNPRLQFRHIRRSGGGYYAVYNIKAPEIPEPKQRFEWYRQFKKEVCDDLVGSSFNIDYPVCIDMYRVVRMVGSPHPSGEICRVVSSYPESKPTRVNETTPQSKTQAASPKLGKESSHLIRFSVTNNVVGTQNCFIPYLELPERQADKIIHQLQEIYHLPDFHVFESRVPGKVAVLTLKIVSQERLEKILRFISVKTGSIGQLLTFHKYRQLWMPVFERTKTQMKTYKLLRTMPGKHHQGIYSEAHAKQFHLPLPPFQTTGELLIRKVQLFTEK